jgi:hypothetical protein
VWLTVSWVRGRAHDEFHKYDRFVMSGVEVSDRPGQRAESPPAESRPAKRWPLLNRRAFDFGLSKPGWFA